jgi:hypothetical protein
MALLARRGEKALNGSAGIATSGAFQETASLMSGSEKGLSSVEAARRLAAYGPSNGVVAFGTGL